MATQLQLATVFNSMSDILFLVLALTISILTIFLVVTLFHLICVLKDVEKITHNVEETTKQVRKYVLKPSNAVQDVLSKTLTVGKMVNRVTKKLSNKKKKL